MKKFTFLNYVIVLMGILLLSIPLNGNNNGGKTVVEVDNLLELRQQAADNTTIYHVTGEVILTHQHGQRNQKYFQDATAAMLVDDNAGTITTTYNLYDGVTGLTGRLTVFNQLLQFVPTEDPGAATSQDNTIEPLLITIADLTPDHQAMLIRINDVEFTGTQTTFAPSVSYPIEDPTGTSIFRTPAASAALDYFNTPIPQEPTDVILLVGQFNADMQVFARSLADFFPDGLPAYTVTFNVIDEAGDAITDAVITFDGETFPAGVYEFEEVWAGSYSYSVAKTGYYTRSGQLAVTGDDILVTVVLVAIDPNAVNSFPWTEDFEGEAFPPATWSHYALGTVGTWASTSTANTGSKAAWHNFTGSAESNSWLVSPQIVVPQDEDMLLKFFHRNSFMNDYVYSGVKISTGSGNPEQEEFVQVFEASTPLANYTERIINLAPYAGQVIYIAFVYQGQGGHQWFVDDITIEEAPDAILLDNISQIRNYEAGGDIVYELTNEVFITHQQLGYRGQIFIQDDSGAIMIDDPGSVIETEYNNYDGITGFRFLIREFQNMYQLLPAEDPGTASSTGNVIEPVAVTLAQLTQDYEAMLVIVHNVDFIDPEGVNFTHNQSYAIEDASGLGTIRTPNFPDLLDYFGDPLPTATVTLVGVVTQRFEETRLLPRTKADFLEPSSIDEIADAGFTMFPNPATSHFTINGENNIDVVRVFNINGQVVLQKQVNSNSVKLEISDLTTGIYIVQVISGNNRLNYKLQVTR